MNITNKTVMITGANRGIGRALVNEALSARALARDTRLFDFEGGRVQYDAVTEGDTGE
jgi:NAD(P)-dependent dehydrogenase (short-subunit alcohol dehydrogenase family)